MRKILVTEDVLNIGHMTYHKGDVILLDDKTAGECVNFGWAEDPETGERNERKPGAQRIKPDNVSQKVK